MKSAYAAGKKSPDTGLFHSWLSESGLTDRSDTLIRRLQREYDRGFEDALNATYSTELSASEVKGFTYKRQHVVPTERGWRIKGGRLDDGTVFDSPEDAKRFIESWNRANPSLLAKAEAAQEERRKLYEELRGRDTTSEWAKERVKRIHALTRIIDKLSRQIAESSNPGSVPGSESVQDKSFREWQENFQRVSADPESASEKDLRRAIGYLNHMRRHVIRVAQEAGRKVSGDVLSGYDAEEQYYMQIIKRRKGNPQRRNCKCGQ